MAAPAKLSPAMQQFMRFKRKHADAILFFRMGDFYEMFYDDAREAAALLGLTLTTRNHGHGSGEVPLAGVPHHAADRYVAKLVQMGKKVAICEQVEDPREARGIVKRDVVQVVSPGTALLDSMLDEHNNNYTIALVPAGDAAGEDTMVGLAEVDLSTGDFSLDELRAAEVGDELQRVGPAELVLAQSLGEDWMRVVESSAPGVPISRLEDWQFEHRHACESLTEQLGVRSLRSFDCDDIDLAVRAAGGVLEYLRENQRGAVAHINRIRRRRRTEHLFLDAAAQRHLELFATNQENSRAGSLIEVLDCTRTAMGARLLRQWLAAPLLDVAAIESRLDAVATLLESATIRSGVRLQLGDIGDLERLIARICCGRANARDLAGLAASLARVPELARLVRELPRPDGDKPTALEEALSLLPDTTGLVDLVRTALVDDPPASIADGGLFRDGYDEELDELREIQSGGKSWIARLQAGERERTGISSLKVGFNQVFGYYIEVSKANLDRVPEDYERKQTLANAERYVIPGLKEREAQILNATERIVERESGLFAELRERVSTWAPEVQDCARAVSAIDVLAALAETAEEGGYVRPAIDDGRVVEISGGRHPVVERQLREGRFVPNDLRVGSDDQILLITGPNMAGKSTAIRQLGIIVILGQMGSFVPARQAHIGVVDRIFTRVGASDNLARGESTFMVEMIEAATILNNVADRSLILMDELGRGTSTFDGLSLAWAIVEHLHERDGIRPRMLFATHYHELTELERKLERVVNYNVAVREEEGRVVFLHRLVPGPADRSYGIHVAEMAGMPGSVVERAREILARLENEQIDAEQIRLESGAAAEEPPSTSPPDNGGDPDCSVEHGERRGQMDLFDQPGELRTALRLLHELGELPLDDTTPMQALQLLHRWRSECDDRDPEGGEAERENETDAAAAGRPNGRG